MRKLDRYLIGEILGPLALGFAVFTLILLLQALFKAAELIIRSGVDFVTVGEYLLLSLPWITVMTIPMALLYGIVIGVGRLSADSELIALRASGVSLFSLYRPILLISLILTALGIYLMLEVLPGGNQKLQQLRVQILSESLTETVEPRIPYTSWSDKLLYVFETPPGEQRWKGVFVSDAIPSSLKDEVLVADFGQSEPVGEDGRVNLALETAISHTVDFSDPESYQVSSSDLMRLKLAAVETKVTTSVRRSLRELSLAQLLIRSRDETQPELVRLLSRVEMHKRFGFPTACLVFGLLALPLGFTSARVGRSSGFVISTGIILIYYLFYSFGEQMARSGRLPAWLAVWSPNFILLGLGFFLLVRRNRDKSLVLRHFNQLVQEKLWSRVLSFRTKRKERKAAKMKVQAQAKSGRTTVVLRIPELRFPFLSRFDRYILGVFVRVLLTTSLACLTVYLVNDLSGDLEEIIKNDVPTSVAFDYYKFKTFQVFYELSPIIVLLTTLISFGLLSRNNEITAIKASGTSLFRLAVPVLLGAFFVSALCGLLESEVLAPANERVAELKAVMRGQEADARRRADRRWALGADTQLFNYSYFDERAQQIRRLQIFKFDDNYRLTGRLLAGVATYAEDGWWIFSDGWARTFERNNELSYETFDAPFKYFLNETPEFFRGGSALPDEMKYFELRNYIRDLQSIGQDVPMLEVALLKKIAHPVTSFAMALVALPFAFRLGKRGTLYGIGLALFLGVVLVIFLNTFSTLGEAKILPPAVAVWSPSLIFSFVSLYLFLGVRT